MIVIRIIIVTLVIVCTVHAAETRTWTGINGKMIQAEFVSESDGQVTLRTENARIIQTKRMSLSRSDQDHLDFLISSTQQTIPSTITSTPLPKPVVHNVTHTEPPQNRIEYHY